MAMDQQVLANELLNLAPTSSEPEAIEVLVEAYRTFAADAESNGVPITAAGLDAGALAMAPQLVGMSVAGQGLVKIPVAVKTFWQGVAAAGPAAFPGALSVTPPPHDNLDDTFPPVCTANSLPGVTAVVAANAIAAVMYPEAILGGMVTFPGPAAFPIL
jgi:hypothetical protein